MEIAKTCIYIHVNYLSILLENFSIYGIGPYEWYKCISVSYDSLQKYVYTYILPDLAVRVTRCVFIGNRNC